MGLITHYTSSGLGGMRTCGDLLGRVQLRNKCKIAESKKILMDKLGVGYDNLGDEIFMREFREEHGLGVVTTVGGAPYGLEAKMNIEEILDMNIRCCDHFRDVCKLHR
jgi:dimethylamine---corrinoid protein Co-methyltransferase